MGSSGSKAAQNTARKFPTRAPGSAPPPSTTARSTRPPPTSRSPPQASYTKDDAIRADSVDPSGFESVNPAFADRLKQMGAVQPNPIHSPSSTVSQFSHEYPSAKTFSKPRFAPALGNTTLGVLEARRRIEKQAKQELENVGRAGSQGREFLDVATVRKVLMMRQRGDSAAEIESTLRIKPGVVARLGPSGLVAPT